VRILARPWPATIAAVCGVASCGEFIPRYMAVERAVASGGQNYAGAN
jgi:hypothetical protein